MFPKLSDNLQPSPLYEKNNLSYETMNEIFKKSMTIPNFAKNVMLHLFSNAELLECMNVRGLDTSQHVVGRCLDEARVETIRQIVDEIAGDLFDQKLWYYCIDRMNTGILRLKKSSRINKKVEQN